MTPAAKRHSKNPRLVGKTVDEEGGGLCSRFHLLHTYLDKESKDVFSCRSSPVTSHVCESKWALLMLDGPELHYHKAIKRPIYRHVHSNVSLTENFKGTLYFPFSSTCSLHKM